jgi:hypothetical protein
MPRRAFPFALVAALAVILGCGPGDPPPPPDSGTGGGGDAGGGGGDGSGAPDPGGGASPGATAWVDVIGGAGVEHVQDLAADPDGGMVALTAIGIDGDRVHQLGLVKIDAGGSEAWARAFDVGAAIGFAGGALAAAPQGHLFLAAGCPSGCGDLGAEVRGTALVRLTGGGDPEWIAALPGAPASNVVADAGGNAVLATDEGAGTVVRSHGRDAAVRWELAARARPVALAADDLGNVLVASGGEVAAVDGEGRVAWRHELGDDVRIAAVGAAGSAVVVVGVSLTGVRGGDVAPGPFVAVLGDDGRVRSTRGLGAGSSGEMRLAVSPAGAALVTRAASCAATVVALEADGGTRWSRPVAPAACGGQDLSVHAVEVLAGGGIAVGGALRGDADLGAGVAQPSATDGFVAGMLP